MYVIHNKNHINKYYLLYLTNKKLKTIKTMKKLKLKKKLK
jgi:hypothetical protein